MTLDQIRYFKTTAETQHIGKASRILNVSPSAISHSLRKLEEDLGQALFEKSGKRIVLSEFGRRFAVRAQDLLNEAESLRSEFRGREMPLEGKVRLAAAHGLSTRFLPEALCRLGSRHPDLIFEVFSLRSAEILKLVVEGQIDVGLCFSPQSHPAVTVHAAIPADLKIAVRRGHPILKKTRGFGKELSALPNALPKAFSGIEICEGRPELTERGIISKPQLVFDSYEVAAEFVKGSDAWCLMPEIMLRAVNLQAVAVPGLVVRSNVSIVTPKGRILPAALEENLRAIFAKTRT